MIARAAFGSAGDLGMADDPLITPHNQGVTLLIGQFVIAWSVFDSILDAAIMKQLGVPAIKSVAVTCGLGFAAKMGVLKSLLSLQGDIHKVTVAKLEEITQLAKRNVLAHGHVFVGNDGLEFIKVDAKDELKARRVKLTFEAFKALLLKINALAGDVQTALSVSDDDRRAVMNIGKSLAASTSTSPRPPSSKKT